MILLCTIALIAIVLVSVWILNLPQFGKIPSGTRLERIKKSPRYKNDAFENTHLTEVLTNGGTIWKILMLNLRKIKTEPDEVVPHEKINIRSLPEHGNYLVWFGHSSYLLQLDGLKILVDPVFSGNASPFSFAGKAYAGSNNYSVEDFDSIDILIITHDHYDHLDYETIKKIHPKVRKIYTSLGVGSHLEHWGIHPTKIIELDWWETSEIDSAITITATPARHFSGRLFARGKTLWSSFVLKVNSKSYYLGGDSGYDTHFTEIGDKYGPFEAALLECGQYNRYWSNIHMMPEEVLLAGNDLAAKQIIPVHWGKFTLSVHPWLESIERITTAAKNQNQTLLVPRNGALQALD